MRPPRFIPLPRLLALSLGAVTPLLATIDRDHDLISDLWNAAYPAATNPAADNDGDGFTNLQESTAGTNPLNPRSRPTSVLETRPGGELQLRWPAQLGKRYVVSGTPDFTKWTNVGSYLVGNGTGLTRTIPPALAAAPTHFFRVSAVDFDADLDGLTDWEETQLGTNPSSLDSDADGMPDGWEALHDLNPLIDDADADPDADGFTNLQERTAGTDPQYRAAPVSGGPFVFWASQPVAPDETILVTSGGSDIGTTAELARLTDGDPGSPPGTTAAPAAWTSITPHTATPRSVTITVPAGWTPGIYALRLKHGGTIGPLRLVNSPDPWFVAGDRGETASPGGTITVAGNCLEMAGPGSEGPRLALVRNGALAATLTDPVRVTASTGYALRYTVPAGTAAGTYQVFVHNGRGGPAGWVKFSTFIEAPLDTFTIATPTAWPTAVFTAAAPTGTGDDAKLATVLAQAAGNGGGTVRLPAGTYRLTQPFSIPNHTVLAGAGLEKTKLEWTVTLPQNPNRKPLVNGESLSPTGSLRGTFALEDLTLIAPPNYREYVVERSGTTERGWFRRLGIVAACYNTKNWDLTPVALFLRQTDNTLLDGVVFDSDQCLSAREGVSHVTLRNSTLRYNNLGIWLSARSRNWIIEGNRLEKQDPWPEMAVLVISSMHGTAVGGPFTRDLLYVGNTHTLKAEATATLGAGYTMDGAAGIYRGGFQMAGPTILQLDTPTIDRKPGSNTPTTYAWTGAVAQIIDGRGAGQWRFLTAATQGSTTVSIDRPWEVEPDSTSIVALNNLQGRLLMIDNNLSSDVQHDDYYLALDSIKAGNRFGHAHKDKTSASATWAGSHYQGTFPAWHLQFLGNTVVSGKTAYLSAVSYNDPASDYDGVVGAAHVYRNNTNANPNLLPNQDEFYLRLLSRHGALADLLVERNQFDSVRFLHFDYDPVSCFGVLLRQNIPAVGGSPVLIPSSPPPGVTTK